MKVENSQTNHIVQKQTENSGQVEKNLHPIDNDRAETLIGKDKASLSDQARLLVKARAQLDETPEIRTDKVEKLREMVDSGTYRVPVERLASLFMKRLFSE